MASTDTDLASTITGVLPSLLQAGAGTAGSLAAANAESNADQNAITTQQNNLGNISGIWANQQQTGQGANTALQSSLGLNGQTANYSNFENMPGYQFAVSQGTQAFQRQAAAMGSAYTPNTAAAIGQYVTGTAEQDYNTYISQLMGAAGLGTTANQGLQTANQTTANNVSQLQQNIGTAQAQGYTGVANSAAGLFNSAGFGNALGSGVNYLMGGGGGGGGYGSGTDGSTGGGYGGEIDTAPPGQTLQYDANGNIIGSADPTTFANSANYGITDPGYGITSLDNLTGSDVAAPDYSSIFNNIPIPS